MRTDDLLALGSHPRAEHVRAFDRRSVLIGAVLTALLVLTALVETAAPSARAFISSTHDAELVGISKSVDRSGFPGLPLLF
jgi:hypothetical protein